MENEARIIRENIKDIEIYELTPQKFYYRGNLNGKDVCLVITGIGKVNSGLLTGLMLAKETFTHIINIVDEAYRYMISNPPSSYNNKKKWGSLSINQRLREHLVE